MAAVVQNYKTNGTSQYVHYDGHGDRENCICRHKEHARAAQPKKITL